MKIIPQGLLETAVERLKAEFQPEEIYLFGSHAWGTPTEDSDVDLMVDFNTTDPLEYTENYFELKFALEKILNRSIDLLENKAIKNPFLRESIDNSKVLIYGQ